MQKFITYILYLYIVLPWCCPPANSDTQPSQVFTLPTKMPKESIGAYLGRNRERDHRIMTISAIISLAQYS